MRYALTYTLGDFSKTNTIIVQVEDESHREGYNFEDVPGHIKNALLVGTNEAFEDVEKIIKNKQYYLRDVDDIDVNITV